MGDLYRVDGEATVKLRWAALRTTLLLSVLFLVAYGVTNWFTASREVSRVWMYERERNIPFVPLMIIPYMSIDLFFIAAPFLCRDRAELRLFARRVMLTVVVACTVFLLLPLKMGVDRPAADGWLGAIFDWFRSMDQPHNLFPSLHIALGVMLAELYARKSRGLLRWVIIAWFLLVGVSTVLTYQHHVIDLVGGFALAVGCFYVIPAEHIHQQRTRSIRIAAYYWIGAVLLILLVVFLWAYESWILLWPAASVAIVGAGYAGLGPAIYRKANRRLAPAARLVLGPALAGQWLSKLFYARRSKPWNAIDDRVLIGRHLSEREAQLAIEHGVTAVVDLTAEFDAPQAWRSLPYLNLQVLDLTAPVPATDSAGIGIHRCADHRRCRLRALQGGLFAFGGHRRCMVDG